MKKKITILCVMLCICLLIPTTVYAANNETVKATISKLKMCFDGSQVKGNVLTYNKVNYIPVSLLTDKLGFKVSTSVKTNKLTITEKVSKEDLQNQVSLLNSKNGELQSQITELNKKLRFYSGGKEDYTGETTDDYFNNVNSATSMGNAVWPIKNNAFIKTERSNDNDTWYKVNLYEGKGLTVALKAQIDTGSIKLELYNKDGRQLDYGYATNGQYVSCGNRASTDTTLYAKVSGAKGIYYIGFYDQYYNNTSSLNDERDYFGSLNTAQKISNGNMEKVDVNLTNWYRVDVGESKTLSVSIIPQIDSGNLKIDLYNSDGKQLDYAYGSNGKVANVSKQASTDCTYFIAISGSKGKYYLSYSLN